MPRSRCSPDPDQYAPFLDKLKAGAWGLEDRRRCALEAFRRTAAYDAAISAWMERELAQGKSTDLPHHLCLNLVQKQGLRYGENPHQAAAFFVEPGRKVEGMAACQQHQGKELSFNNLLDADACARLVWQFPAPACVIVKHNNPCGVGQGPHALEAFMRAQAGDPVSAFGGIVAFNRPVGVEVARVMAQNFWEVILAPAFTGEALEVFAAKKQLRILQTPDHWPQSAEGLDARSIGGGYLVQRADDGFVPFEDWEVKATGPGTKPRGGGPDAGPAGGQGREVQRHRAGEGRRHRGHRRGPDEPRGFRGDRLPQGRRPVPAAPCWAATPSSPSPTASSWPPATASPPSSNPAAASATTKSSPPPRSSASGSSSPACGTSGIELSGDRAHDTTSPANCIWQTCSALLCPIVRYPG